MKLATAFLELWVRGRGGTRSARAEGSLGSTQEEEGDKPLYSLEDNQELCDLYSDLKPDPTSSGTNRTRRGPSPLVSV